MIATAEAERLWKMKGWSKDRHESVTNPVEEVWLNVVLYAKAYVRRGDGGKIVGLRIVPLH